MCLLCVTSFGTEASAWGERACALCGAVSSQGVRRRLPCLEQRRSQRPDSGPSVQAPVPGTEEEAAQLMKQYTPAATKALYTLIACGLPSPPLALIATSQLLWLPAAALCFLRYWRSHALMTVLACSVLAVLSSPFYIVASYLLVLTGSEAGVDQRHFCTALTACIVSQAILQCVSCKQSDSKVLKLGDGPFLEGRSSLGRPAHSTLDTMGLR